MQRPRRPRVPPPQSERPVRPAEAVRPPPIRSPPAAAAAAATEPTAPLLGVQSSATVPPVALPEEPTPAELEFRESVERYSHADWAREQRAEPACEAAIRYLLMGSPPVAPEDFLSHIPSQKRPPMSEIRSLTDKGRLHRDDDGTILLVRKPTPAANDSADKPRSLPHIVNARALLLVDWDEHQHTMVASALPQVPSPKNVSKYGALAYPFAPLALWAWNRGKRRLFWPPPGYAKGEFLYSPFY